MSKYIVTGGAGFIGSSIVEELLRNDHQVVVIDDLSTGFEKNLPMDNENLTLLNIDIAERYYLNCRNGELDNVDGLFHAAACARIQPAIENPKLCHDNNVTGLFNVLEMMRSRKIKNIVFSSSSSIYGQTKCNSKTLKESMHPDCLNPYSVSKYIGEQYIKTWTSLYDIDGISLRYFNVYGPKEVLQGQYAPVIGLFFKQLLKEKKNMTIVGDGNQKRDFTHVNDVVSANILAMNRLEDKTGKKYSGAVINIGTGSNSSINDISKLIEDSIKKHPILSKKVKNIGKNYIAPRPAEAQATLADNSKAKSILNWTPAITIQQGVEELCNYYCDYYLDKFFI